MDGAPNSYQLRWPQNRRIQLWLGFSTQDFFNFIQITRRFCPHPHATRMAAGWRVPLKVNEKLSGRSGEPGRLHAVKMSIAQDHPCPFRPWES